MKTTHACRALISAAVVFACLAGASAVAALDRPSADGSPKADIEAAVLATNAEMVAAADRLDLDTFFDFIVDTNQTTIVQNGVIFGTRQEAHDAVKRGLQGIAQINRRFENPKVTVIAPEVALLVSEGSVAAKLDDGRAINSRFTVSLVFVLRDGRWKVLHGHYSVPPDQQR